MHGILLGYDQVEANTDSWCDAVDWVDSVTESGPVPAAQPDFALSIYRLRLTDRWQLCPAVHGYPGGDEGH